MSRRATLFVPGIVVVSLILAACGPNTGQQQTPRPTQGAGGGPGATGAAGELQAEGQIFAYGVSYGTADEIAQERVHLFRRNYPDVFVEYSESGFESQGFLAALQSDVPPDVVSIPRDRIGTYIARGVLEPLDDCISRAGVDTGVFYEAPLTQVTVDGSIYGLPTD